MPCKCICVDICKYVPGGHICPIPLANRVRVHIALAFRKFSMTKKRTYCVTKYENGVPAIHVRFVLSMDVVLQSAIRRLQLNRKSLPSIV